MGTVIDWEILAGAVDFYHLNGYTRIDVPWMVDYSTVRATFTAEDSRIFEIKDNDAQRWAWFRRRALVGSAEQSFYQMIRNETLTPGKYVACSPCFRNEPETDWLHQRQFMKVELINTVVEQQSLILEEMFELAWLYFSKIAGRENLTRVSTLDGFDIELCGIEIGSYGIRTIDTHSWVYGTGVAEPRFSTALAEQNSI